MVYDCETGGLNPNENPITQFATIVLDYKTLKEVDRWETYIQPYNDLKITEESIKASNVTMSDINKGITHKEFVKALTGFIKVNRKTQKEIGRLISVGHNVSFDNGFIDYALKLSGGGISEHFHPSSIDTLILAKMVWGIDGNEKLTLGSCCDRVGIPLIGAHGAMVDTEATAELFRYFVKKMRSSKGGKNDDRAERKKGREFFEFKCSK